MARPAHDYARVDKHVPVTRRAETTNPYSPVTILIALVATLGILLYAQFLLNPANRGDFLPYALVITAETILITHALLAMWTILSGAKSPRDFAFYESQNAMFDKKAIKAAASRSSRTPGRSCFGARRSPSTSSSPSTARNSPRSMPPLPRRSRSRASTVPGSSTTAGPTRSRRSPRNSAATTCAGLSSNGAKAGNINHALVDRQGRLLRASSTPTSCRSRTSSSRPCRSSSTSDVAFVQTPQAYGNLHNLISRGAGYMQAVFYKFIQPGRNHFNAAFCVGTNVIFRRAAINDIGGMYTDSKSEDVWTSLMLHERGWRTIYIPMTLADRRCPRDHRGLHQAAAALGDRRLRDHAHPQPAQPAAQAHHRPADQYLVTATHYLAGIAPLLLLLVPPLEIFFDLRR